MEERLVASKAKHPSARLKVWGCRGSSSVSGPQVLRYGGDTSCYVVEGAGHRCIFDAGTGLAHFSREERLVSMPTTMFLSHYHMDHLQGFPFFQSIFDPEFSLEVAAVRREGVGALEALFHAHRPPFFPVSLQDVCRLTLASKDLPVEGEQQFGALRVRWMDGPHPGGASAYRMEIGGESLVLITDVELLFADATLRAFVADADIAVLDAQYTADEYVSRQGWGHSTPTQAAKFAAETGIKALYLTHHDPSRSDAEIDALVELAREHHPRVYAAFDGMSLEWGAGRAAHAGVEGSQTAPLFEG